MHTGRNIVSQKVHFSGSKLTCNFLYLVDQSSADFFSSDAGGIALIGRMSFQFLDMLPRSGDIRNQNLKWYKIDRNFAGNFCGVANLWICIIKFSQFPVTWQSFSAMIRGISGMPGERKTSRVKHKTSRTTVRADCLKKLFITARTTRRISVFVIQRIPDNEAHREGVSRVMLDRDQTSVCQ